MQPILDEDLNDYPSIQILLRGDSGFATPDLYQQCEENDTGYVIRLKENGIFREKASHLADELDEITRDNKVDCAVVYGEFMYKAGSWSYERRVVCKVEKPENQQEVLVPKVLLFPMVLPFLKVPKFLPVPYPVCLHL